MEIACECVFRVSSWSSYNLFSVSNRTITSLPFECEAHWPTPPHTEHNLYRLRYGRSIYNCEKYINQDGLKSTLD